MKDKKIQSGIKVRKNSIITHKSNKMRNGEVRNQTRNFLKWKRKMRIWKYDGLLRQPFHLSREPMANTCICNQVSKHGERDDDEGIFTICHKNGLTIIDII